jgi:hypothetical protein
MQLGLSLRASLMVLALGLTASFSVSWVNPVAVAATGAKIHVDRSVDPDGFILNNSQRRAASELPPVCVGAEDGHPEVGLARVEIRNGCNAPQRVKVLIAFWFDSACLIVSPGGTREYEYANSARFDGLEAC